MKIKLEGYPTDFKASVETSDFRRVEERRFWDLSLLFLEGKQWAQYDNSTTRLVGGAGFQGGESWRITVNLLINIYRNILSTLSTEYPSIAVTPATALTDDILKAQATEIALKYYWQKDKLKTKLSLAFSWLLSCGTVGLHSYYDELTEEVTTEVVNPFDLIFEPYVSSPEESDWIAVRRHVKKYELIKQFPKHKKLIEEASDSMDPSNRPGDASFTQIPEGRLEIFEVYWRDGKHAFVLGSDYLYQGFSPLKRIPIQIIRYTEVPGRLWGVGLIAPLIDMQWLYNKSRSQVLQNIELMSNPKWLIPKTAGVNPNAITNRPGEKVFYNQAGGKPEQIGASPLPSHVFDNITRLQSEMMDVSGIHSTTLGKRAVGVTSGKAINALQSGDKSQLMITMTYIEEAAKNLAESVIDLMKHNYKETKMIRMLDGLGTLVYKELKNTDIVDNPEVFIDAGSLFRDEAQDRDAKILNLYEMKLIEPHEALQELSYRTGNKHVVRRMETMAHADELLQAAVQGYDIEIFRTDDLAMFIEVFGGYMRQPIYYTLPPERQDYIRDIFISIETAMLPADQKPDLEETLVNSQVYPKVVPPKKDEEQLQAALTQNSPQAQAATMNAQLDMEQLVGSMGAAETSLAKGSEALLSTKRGGMG